MKHIRVERLKKIIKIELVNHLIFSKTVGDISIEKLSDDIIVAIENHIKFERDNQPINKKDFHG